MIAALSLMAQMQLPTQTSTQRGGVKFTTSVSADTVYAGAQLSYDGIMRIGVAEKMCFLVPPAYTPPTMPGAVVYSMPLHARAAIRDVRVGAATFKEYRYHHVIFPLTSGLDTVSATQLRYTRLNEADPYASDSTILRSPSRAIVVLPLPAEGRPADFSGAVGAYTISIAAEASNWRVGSGVVVRARVSGMGNVALIPRPALHIPWATVLATTDSIVWDSTATVARGFREFRWLVTPQSGGHHEIPAVRYSSFDPDKARYFTSTTNAIPVRVAGEPGEVRDPQAVVSATPFPTLVRVVRQHPIVVLIGVAVVLVVLVLVSYSLTQQTYGRYRRSKRRSQ